MPLVYRARVDWLSAEQGGRKLPPSGPRYSSPVRFEDWLPGAEGANWSLVVELVDRSTDSMTWTANVHFLVPDGPSESLKEGARFELYEGRNCVAQGAILPGTIAVNSTAQPVAAPHQVG